MTEFTTAEKREFIKKHTWQLAVWQQPHLVEDYMRYADTAGEDWVNDSFYQLSRLYGHDATKIVQIIYGDKKP